MREDRMRISNYVERGVESNMIHGDLRYMNRSTAMANRDALNIELESAVTQQPLPSTTSLSTSRYWVLKLSTDL
jgi:hypothetical protein